MSAGSYLDYEESPIYLPIAKQMPGTRAHVSRTHRYESSLRVLVEFGICQAREATYSLYR